MYLAGRFWMLEKSKRIFSCYNKSDCIGFDALMIDLTAVIFSVICIRLVHPEAYLYEKSHRGTNSASVE